jgi:adenylosuccinate synthase
VAGAACAGAGIGPTHIHHVVGIVKAYTTRVGAGPFPTELEDSTGDYIQSRGKEFGATTGRRRRCGWLDLVLVGDSVRLNGLSSLAITKLDILTGIDTLKICVAYDLDGRTVHRRPASLKRLARCRPVYREMPGWDEDISAARRFEDFPLQTREYLNTIAEATSVPLSVVSVGPGREETIVLLSPF